MVIREGPGRGPRNAADQHPLFQEGEEGGGFPFCIKFCYFFFSLLEIAGERRRGKGGFGETFAPSIHAGWKTCTEVIGWRQSACKRVIITQILSVCLYVCVSVCPILNSSVNIRLIKKFLEQKSFISSLRCATTKNFSNLMKINGFMGLFHRLFGLTILLNLGKIFLSPESVLDSRSNQLDTRLIFV